MKHTFLQVNKDLNTLDQMQQHQFEHIHFFHDPKTSLKAIIAIHNTTLGPALGGCRFYPYASETDALNDVMKLSRAMTYKAAVSGLNLGGGKSVILGDPKKIKNTDMMLAFGACIERLKGEYYTAVDSGTTSQDMDTIRDRTKYVTGCSPQKGGAGDPSPITALGVFHGIRAALKFKFGSDEVKGKTIAIQGIGNVGLRLSHLLFEAGAKLILSDTNLLQLQTLSKTFSCETLPPSEILKVRCDVLAPCALGGILDEATISTLQTTVIAGGANNQLKNLELGKTLHDKEITYAPDFVINAGGLIHVNQELTGDTQSHVLEKTKNIYDTILAILNRSKIENKPSNEVAIRMAKERITQAGGIVE